MGISHFWISGQSLIKENCHNSRTNDDIDMKLGPVTKLDKRNKAMSKKIDDDNMYLNCDVIVIFVIYDQFEAIQKLDFREGERGGGNFTPTPPQNELLKSPPRLGLMSSVVIYLLWSGILLSTAVRIVVVAKLIILSILF